MDTVLNIIALPQVSCANVTLEQAALYILKVANLTAWKVEIIDVPDADMQSMFDYPGWNVAAALEDVGDCYLANVTFDDDNHIVRFAYNEVLAGQLPNVELPIWIDPDERG